MAFKQTYSQKLPQYTVKKRNEQNAGLKIKAPSMPQRAPTAVKIRVPEPQSAPIRAAITPPAPKAPSVPKPAAIKPIASKPATAPVIKHAASQAHPTGAAVKIKMPEPQAAPKNRAAIEPAIKYGGVKMQLPTAIKMPVLPDRDGLARVNYQPPAPISPVQRDAAAVQRYYLEQAARMAIANNKDAVVNLVQSYNIARTHPFEVMSGHVPEAYQDPNQQPHAAGENAEKSWKALGVAAALGGVVNALQREGAGERALGATQGVTAEIMKTLGNKVKSYLPEEFRDVITISDFVTHPQIVAQSLKDNLPTLKAWNKKNTRVMTKSAMDILDDLGISPDNFSHLSPQDREHRYRMWSSAADPQAIAKYVLLDRIGNNVLNNLTDVPGVYQIDRELLSSRWHNALNQAFDPETLKIVSNMRNIGAGTGKIIPAIPENVDIASRPRAKIDQPASLRVPDTVAEFPHLLPAPRVKWAGKETNTTIDDVFDENLKHDLEQRNQLLNSIETLKQNVTATKELLAARIKNYNDAVASAAAGAQRPDLSMRINEITQNKADIARWLNQIEKLQESLLNVRQNIFETEYSQRSHAFAKDEAAARKYKEMSDQYFRDYLQNQKNINKSYKVTEDLSLLLSDAEQKLNAVQTKHNQIVDPLQTAVNNANLMWDDLQALLDANNLASYESGTYNTLFKQFKDKYIGLLPGFGVNDLKGRSQLNISTLVDPVQKMQKAANTALENAKTNRTKELKPYENIIANYKAKLEEARNYTTQYEAQSQELKTAFDKNEQKLLGEEVQKKMGELRILREKVNGLSNIIGEEPVRTLDSLIDTIAKPYQDFEREITQKAMKLLPSIDLPKDGAKDTNYNLPSTIVGGAAVTLGGVYTLNKLSKLLDRGSQMLIRGQAGNDKRAIPIGQKPEGANIPKISSYHVEDVPNISDVDLRVALQDYLTDKTWGEKAKESLSSATDAISQKASSFSDWIGSLFAREAQPVVVNDGQSQNNDGAQGTELQNLKTENNEEEIDTTTKKTSETPDETKDNLIKDSIDNPVVNNPLSDSNSSFFTSIFNSKIDPLSGSGSLNEPFLSAPPRKQAGRSTTDEQASLLAQNVEPPEQNDLSSLPKKVKNLFGLEDEDEDDTDGDYRKHYVNDPYHK